MPRLRLSPVLANGFIVGPDSGVKHPAPDAGWRLPILTPDAGLRKPAPAPDAGTRRP